jgi:hypothetical protein
VKQENLKKKNKEMGKYTIFKGKDNQFYFNLKAVNHEIILQSEGYKQKEGAENGVKSVQTNSSDNCKYERLISVENEPYFVLKAENGKIIGKSEMYSSNQAMENGIKSVILNGTTTNIEYLFDVDYAQDLTIIVNGRKKDWDKRTISFKEVVILAFNSYVENARTCYTITYCKGVESKSEGSMVENQEVNVKPNMIFNVTATDKS